MGSSYVIVISQAQVGYHCYYIMGSSYVIVISQAQVGYHCYYTRPRVRPKVKCYNNDILRVFKHLCVAYLIRL